MFFANKGIDFKVLVHSLVVSQSVLVIRYDDISVKSKKGYFEKDFQMPWRFWMIHKDTSIAESGMMNPSPFLRHKGTLLNDIIRVT